MPSRFLEKLKGLFSRRAFDQAFLDDLEDILIEDDLGAKLSAEVMRGLKEGIRLGRVNGAEEVVALLRENVKKRLAATKVDLAADGLNVFMVLGANGSGKTSTIAKLARYYSSRIGPNAIILAAADTFRAGATEQLAHHAKALGIEIVTAQSGSDPGSVVYSAIDRARAKPASLLIIDTAGRMQNQLPLMNELKKMDKIVRARAEGAHYLKFITLDATLGRHVVEQVRVFHQAVGLDGALLTKYDSSAKAGTAIGISEELGLAIAFVASGEGYDDFSPFEIDAYLERLLGNRDA